MMTISKEALQLNYIQEAKKQLQEWLSASGRLTAIFADDSNAQSVHNHTGELGDKYRTILSWKWYGTESPTGQILRKAETLEFKDVHAELIGATPDADKPAMQRVLANIRGTDKEVGLPMQLLLKQVYLLATKAPTGPMYQLTLNGSNVSPMTLLIQNLLHNISAGGGCKPGINGRLMLPFTALLLKHLEREEASMLEILQPPTDAQSQVSTHDSELERAIAASLKTHRQASVRETKQEEEQLQVAMAMSLSLAEQQLPKQEKKEESELEKTLALSMTTAANEAEIRRAIALSLASPQTPMYDSLRAQQASMLQPLPEGLSQEGQEAILRAMEEEGELSREDQEAIFSAMRDV